MPNMYIFLRGLANHSRSEPRDWLRRQCLEEGSCEHDNESMGSIRGEEFTDHLSDFFVSQEGLCSMELVDDKLVRCLPLSTDTHAHTHTRAHTHTMASN
jgi:hypothetical protein